MINEAVVNDVPQRFHLRFVAYQLVSLLPVLAGFYTIANFVVAVFVGGADGHHGGNLLVFLYESLYHEKIEM